MVTVNKNGIKLKGKKKNEGFGKVGKVGKLEKRNEVAVKFIV